jgi:hypothetical protein
MQMKTKLRRFPNKHMNEIKIRIAGLKDSLEIAGLMSQLGYPTSSDEMEERLAAILLHSDYKMSAIYLVKDFC